MLLGIFLFAIGMCVYTSSNSFYRLSRKPFMRRTLYIGYGARIFISIFVPIGAFTDLYPGLISLMIVADGLNIRAENFMGTLLTTLLQGTFLNIILVLFMSIIWVIQASFMTAPVICEAGCKTCGYDLSMTQDGSPCPECGSLGSPGEIESSPLSRRPMWLLLTISFCTGILLLMLVSIMEF